jgi:hypothetical protein
MTIGIAWCLIGLVNYMLAIMHGHHAASHTLRLLREGVASEARAKHMKLYYMHMTGYADLVHIIEH